MNMENVNSPQQGQTAGAPYQYNYTYLEPIAMLDKLPVSENFSDPWLVLTGIQVIKLAINTLLANQGLKGQEVANSEVREFIGKVLWQTLQEQGKSLNERVVKAFMGLLPQILSGEVPDSLGAPPSQPLTGTVAIPPDTVEQALVQLLRNAPSTESSLAISQEIQKILAKPLPPRETRASIALGIGEALQKPLLALPANEEDVKAFVASNLAKILGQDFFKAFAKYFFTELNKKAPTGRASSLEDYKKLFAYIELPAIANTFEDDSVFAYTRLAGSNPVIIEQMTAPDPRFPVTEEQYKARMGDGDSLETAIREGRVYLADYGVLEGALNGTFGASPPLQKYVPAPLAMFAVPPVNATDRQLAPVAIQCGQSPANYPVITPATGPDAWLMAKTAVGIADIIFHEAVTHFARTHALIEPFAIATHRQLPADHPLSILLLPHFQGTFAINAAAHEFLIAPKGGVNGLLSPTIDNARVLMVKGLRIRGFNDDMFPKRLRDRGVDDVTALPIYPYRDDGLLIWDAIHAWVTAYLGLYYHSDGAIQSDANLQNWARELVSFEGGRLPGFGEHEDGSIESLSYLIDAVTMVIFTASAQHAAVNFPQNSLMSFAPAMPTAGYLPFTAIGSGSTRKDWFDLLPPLDQAQSQLNLLYLLGSVYFTRLGVYETGHFADLRVAEPLRQFQQSLEDAEATIDFRNTTRPVYDFLRPSLIPQSINI
jgi:arachidonate 15-lipoxygenase